MRFGRRQDRARAIAAIAAVVAMLAQVILPTAAHATASQTLQLCTAEGARTVAIKTPGAPAKGPMGLPCHDCLAASLAIVVAPSPTVVPLRWAVSLDRPTETRRVLALPIRGPPRPPGQAPPLSPNA